MMKHQPKGQWLYQTHSVLTGLKWIKSQYYPWAIQEAFCHLCFVGLQCVFTVCALQIATGRNPRQSRVLGLSDRPGHGWKEGFCLWALVTERQHMNLRWSLGSSCACRVPCPWLWRQLLCSGFISAASSSLELFLPCIIHNILVP